jgi:hypothetical protein
MKTFGVVLRTVALVLAWLFSVGGLMFALGYAWDDPGGWAALALTLAAVVPLSGLTVLAVREPALAFTVLAVGVGLVAAWAVLSLFVDLVDAPVVPVVTLVLVAPLAVVGQTFAQRAGALMLALAAVPFGLVLVRLVQESGAEGPGVRDLLGGSTGVVVLPLLVLALLLLVAGSQGRAGVAPDEQPTEQPPRTPVPMR